MFGTVAQKFKKIFSSIGEKKQLTEENIAEAVREVRLALLDADVQYGVVSAFVSRVKEKALGKGVTKAVSAGDQFVKLVHEELVDFLGKEEVPLTLSQTPSVFLLCGLQGSGKTTQAAKLAYLLRGKGFQKKVLVAACDLQRPAAVLQLKKLCEDSGTSMFSIEGETNPVQVAKEALVHAKKEGFDVLILDTAGRLHIDEPLMEELKAIRRETTPQEVLFVANSGTGQEAVRIALEFDQKIGITGTILTMLDSSARAGAALSIREVTKKPLKFEGVGEKIGDLRLFNPHSMADRVLGMGDVIHLVKKAEEEYDEEETKRLKQKFQKNSFTYSDYLTQMGRFKKMGPLKSLLQMIPGASDLPDLDKSEDEFGKIEAMILSMTKEEREESVELIPSRRWRIAKGSGRSVSDVDKLIKGFKQMKSMMKNMPNKKQLEKFTWR